jgi:hypothetical protein
MKFFTIIGLLLFCTQVSTQNYPDYGSPDNSIPQLSEFEYYKGEWKTKMEMKQNDGSFKKIKFEATIKARFLEDHRTFQTQFIGSKGFFSTDVRTYNIRTNQWEALFINSKAQRWHKFSSKIIDGKMTTIVKGGYSGKEEFDVKIIDTIKSKKQYLRNVYHSKDKMKSWKHIYRITITRVTE